jgi:hypothetical protein
MVFLIPYSYFINLFQNKRIRVSTLAVTKIVFNKPFILSSPVVSSF